MITFVKSASFIQFDIRFCSVYLYLNMNQVCIESYYYICLLEYSILF